MNANGPNMETKSITAHSALQITFKLLKIPQNIPNIQITVDLFVLNWSWIKIDCYVFQATVVGGSVRRRRAMCLTQVQKNVIVLSSSFLIPPPHSSASYKCLIQLLYLTEVKLHVYQGIVCRTKFDLTSYSKNLFVPGSVGWWQVWQNLMLSHVCCFWDGCQAPQSQKSH